MMNTRAAILLVLAILSASCSKDTIVDTAKESGPAAPIPVSPANMATGINTSPTLSWTGSSGVSTYQLQISTDSSFSSLLYNQAGLTGTTQPISGLAGITTYFWRVNATNNGGTSTWSSPVWRFTTAGNSSISIIVNGKTNCILLDSTIAAHMNIPAGAYSVQATGRSYYASPAADVSSYDNVFALYAGADNKNHLVSLPIDSTRTLSVRNDGNNYVFYSFYADWSGLGDNSGITTIHCGSSILSVGGKSNCILLDASVAQHTVMAAGTYSVQVTGSAYYASPASSANTYDNVLVMYSGGDNRNHLVALPIGSTRTLTIRNDGNGFVLYAFFADWLGTGDNSGDVAITFTKQ